MLEENKCHDIVEAILDNNLDKIEISRKDMGSNLMKATEEMDLTGVIFFLFSCGDLL